MNRYLDRIAAVALLIFALLCLFLLITVTRYFQSQITEAEIQAEIEHLQDTTEELQETVDQMQAQVDDREVSENLEVIDQTLVEMSEQIEQIGDDLGALPTEEPASSAEPAEMPSIGSVDEAITLQDELLTLIGWTVGLLSILTAAAWASFLIMRGKRRKRPSPLTKDMW